MKKTSFMTWHSRAPWKIVALLPVSLLVACTLNEPEPAADMQGLGVRPFSAFELTVSTQDLQIDVKKPNGTFDICRGFCTFAYLGGTTLTITPVLIHDTPNCLQFDQWSGACAGQGSTCHVTVNSDLTTEALYIAMSPCNPL